MFEKEILHTVTKLGHMGYSFPGLELGIPFEIVEKWDIPFEFFNICFQSSSSRFAKPIVKIEKNCFKLEVPCRQIGFSHSEDIQRRRFYFYFLIIPASGDIAQVTFSVGVGSKPGDPYMWGYMPGFQPSD